MRGRTRTCSAPFDSHLSCRRRAGLWTRALMITRGICMSTFTVDDALYQRATEAAAAQGKTVDEFVGEALRRALSAVGVWRTVRNGLPVMVVSDDTPPIDPADVRQHLEEEGF